VKQLLRDEARDGLRLLTCAAASLLVWILFLGMRPGLIPFGEDARELDWPAWVELLRVNGDLSRWTYRAGYIGGGRFLELAGSPAFSSIATTLHLSAAHALFLAAWLSQTLLAYLGVAAVEGLVVSWGGKELHLRMTVPIAIAVAFMPIIGVRFYAGHASMVTAYLAFAAPAAILLVVRAGRAPSVVSLLVVAAAVRVTLSSGLQQMVLYAALFGGLVLLPILWNVLRRREVVPLLVAVTAGIALALPVFSVMLAAARSDDAARTIGGTTLTWSWGITRWHDWSTLVTAGGDLIRSRTDEPWAFHETQVPLGLAIAGCILVPWKKERGLRVTLPLALLLVVVLAMKVEPLASLLVRLVPPLGSFRVPGRGIAPIAIFATWLAIAGFVRDSERVRTITRIHMLAAFTALLAMVVLPGAIGEAAALVIVLGAALVPRFVPRSFGVVAMAVASVVAVARVLPPPVSEQRLIADTEKFRGDLATIGALPAHALDRVIIDLPTASGMNGLAAHGLPSPFGYWFPTRRRIELHEAAHAIDAPSTLHSFMPTEPPFGVSTRTIALLYNVRTWMHYERNGKPIGGVPLPTIGAAWMPRRFIQVPALGPALRTREPNALRSDVPTTTPRKPLDAGCDGGRVQVTATPDGGQRVALAVDSPGSCLVALPINFTTRHRATLNGRSLEVIPIYGALLGVLVPQASGALIVEHVVPTPRWGAIGGVAGWVLLVAAIALRARAAFAR
jgi:hypothetical protein